MPCCSFSFCHNISRRGCGKTFHRFPLKQPTVLKAWLKNMRQEHWLPTELQVICSDHFEETAFDKTGQRVRLRSEAVPTIFDFSAPPKLKRLQLQRFQHTPGAVGPLKRCLYVGCDSTDERNDLEEMKFVKAPSAKCNAPRRRLWLESCGRSDLCADSLTFTDHFKYYVCWKHFVGGNGPTPDYQDPVPYTDTDQMEVTGDDDNNYDNYSMILPDQTYNEPQILPEDEYHPIKVEILEVDQDYQPSDNNVTIVNKLSSCSFSLNDIRANYIVPEDWTLCVTSSTIFFTKINEATDSFLLKFIINEDLTTRVQVFGEDLDESHQLFQTFPKAISSVESLNQCFAVLDNFSPCCGNSEKSFISLYIQRPRSFRGVLNSRTDSLHSLTCHVLTNSKAGLCLSCQVQRGLLTAKLERYIDKCNVLGKNSNGHNIKNKFHDYTKHL